MFIDLCVFKNAQLIMLMLTYVPFKTGGGCIIQLVGDHAMVQSLHSNQFVTSVYSVAQ